MSFNAITTKSPWFWKEIEIPTPSGFMRGKLWSNSEKHRSDRREDAPKKEISKNQDSSDIREVNGSAGSTKNSCSESGHTLDRFIALHGWQDNCGTFDTLIPILLAHREDKDLSPEHEVTIAAIDLPGHGMSSHYPIGAFYTDIAFAIDLKRVVTFLNWPYFSLLGHSMGGYVSIFYASLFPGEVKRVIMLDICKPLTFKKDKLTHHFATSIQNFLQLESKISQKDAQAPVYTKSEATDRLIQAHSKYGKLRRESALILLERGCKIIDEQKNSEEPKVVFTRDPRLHAIFFSRFDVSTVKAYMSTLKCELYIIKAKDGIKLEEDDVVQEFIALYKSVCKKFELIVVPGYHHVHLCDPSRVANEISKILSIREENTNGHLDSSQNSFDDEAELSVST